MRIKISLVRDSEPCKQKKKKVCQWPPSQLADDTDTKATVINDSETMTGIARTGMGMNWMNSESDPRYNKKPTARTLAAA